jgi:hypothetical protein
MISRCAGGANSISRTRQVGEVRSRKRSPSPRSDGCTISPAATPAACVHSAIGVAVKPGEKIVNWIPAFRVSACADSVSAFTPAFAAA